MHSSAGTGSQRSLNMRSSSISSGSQSVPEIGYLEVTEVDNSNTVFIQNHGSVGNNGMQNHGSSGSYGIQNQGNSGGFGVHNGNSGMQNLGSSGSYGTQNQGSSGSVGLHNQGSSSSGISDMNYQSVGYY